MRDRIKYPAIFFQRHIDNTAAKSRAMAAREIAAALSASPGCALNRVSAAAEEKPFRIRKKAIISTELDRTIL